MLMLPPPMRYATLPRHAVISYTCRVSITPRHIIATMLLLQASAMRHTDAVTYADTLYGLAMPPLRYAYKLPLPPYYAPYILLLMLTVSLLMPCRHDLTVASYYAAVDAIRRVVRAASLKSE